MTQGPLSLVLDLSLIILLVIAVIYCWRLDRRLNALRTGQDGIRAAAAELMAATQAAETAVRALRASAQDAGRDLQSRIDDARALSERLGLGAGRIRSTGDVGGRPGRNP